MLRLTRLSSNKPCALAGNLQYCMELFILEYVLPQQPAFIVLYHLHLPPLLPLFEMVNAYELVYSWFEYLRSGRAIKTTCFVIMPNHMHCILFFPTEQYDLSKIVANGKRFIAYEIVKRLKEKNCNKILIQLQEGLSAKQLEKGQRIKYLKKALMQSLFIIENFCCKK